MLNPINFITPPLLFLYVSKFCLEERLARPPAVAENFLSLLIFPAPYGATDTSPAGCSRPCSSQQTSSGSGCHLRRPVHLSEQNRAQQNGNSSSVLTSPPETSTSYLTKSDSVSEIHWNAIRRRRQVKTRRRLCSRPMPWTGTLEKSSWKKASKIMPDVCMQVCQSVFERVHACVFTVCLCVCVFRGLEVCLWQSHGREHFILVCHWLEKGL